MTDSNRVKVSFIEEDEWGETPAGPLQLIAPTGETFSGVTGTSVSQRIRSDRQAPGIVRLSENASGDLNLELHADKSALDVFLRQLLQSEEWSRGNSTTDSLSIVENTDSSIPGDFELTMSGAFNVPGGMLRGLRGCWLRISGVNLNAGNTGYFQIAYGTSLSSVTVFSDSMEPQVLSSATIELAGVIRNGTNFSSNTIQRENSQFFAPEVFSVPGNPGVPAVPAVPPVPAVPGAEFYTYTGPVSVNFVGSRLRIGFATAFGPINVGDTITISNAGDGFVEGDYLVLAKPFETSFEVDDAAFNGFPFGQVNVTITRQATAGSPEIPGTPEIPAIPAIPATGDFHVYTGMSPATLSMSVVPEDFITATIGFVGRRESSQSTSAGTGAELPASTNESLTSSNDVGGIMEGGGLTSLDISNIALNIDNAIAPRQVIGQIEPISLRSGRMTVSGTLEAYYASRDLYEKAKTQVDSSISFRMEDGLGRARIFTIPNLKYTGRNASPGGLDSDVIAQMEWQAYAGDAGYMIQIDRFGPTD